MKKLDISNENTINRWVIGDIHGCFKTFKKIIEERIFFTKNDQLFLLGDYIDRGPDSYAVLNYIINLQEQGFSVFTLRGNHEEYLLEALDEYDQKTFEFFVKKLNKSGSLLDEQGKLNEKHIAFMQKLPYHIELNTCHLVHAGFNFRKENPLEDYYSMLTVRFQNDYSVEYEKIIGEKFVVHGHQPTSIVKIKEAIAQRKKIIPLDNGCVYKRRKHKNLPIEELGNLCALNIDTFELIIQENVE